MVNNVSAFSVCFKAEMLGDSPGSMDNDPAFIQLVDAAWQAIGEGGTHDALTIQVIMQDVNNLSAYFTKNGPPTQANNPKAYAVYQAIGTGMFSLGGACAAYGTSNCAGAVQAFQSGQMSFSGLYNALNAFGSEYKDSSNQKIETDLDNLQGALQMYNWYMQQKHKDPSELPGLLSTLANAIKTFATDASTAGLSDGYLTNITTMLNTPLTPDGSDTLLAAANAYLASPTTDTTFQAALTNIGESSSNDGGYLQQILSNTLSKEYGG